MAVKKEEDKHYTCCVKKYGNKKCDIYGAMNFIAWRQVSEFIVT